jgi:hypothetical protein
MRPSRAQLNKNLAIDSLIQIGADFMGAGHCKLKPDS